MTGSYQLGDRIYLQGTFTGEDDALADPTAIVCKVKDPSGNVTTYTYALAQITRVSLGVFRVSIDLDESGTWYYRFVGTGLIVAADETEFFVEESEFD